VAVRLQEGFLNEVGGIGLALQPPADLHAGQQFQVAAVALQELPQRSTRVRPRQV
jgi:hypothetical protein